MIDTKAKRISAMAFSDGLVLPELDGTIDADDRVTLVGMYGGFFDDGEVLLDLPAASEVTPSDQELSDFFFGSSTDDAILDTIEVSHPSFTQTYYAVRNATCGLTAFTEDGDEVEFEYTPMSLTTSDSKRDLDYQVTVELGDLGTIARTEVPRIRSDERYNVRPLVTFRSYASSDLSAPLISLRLQIDQVDMIRTGSRFDAKAPALNRGRIGQLIKLGVFPMARGL